MMKKLFKTITLTLAATAMVLTTAATASAKTTGSVNVIETSETFYVCGVKDSLNVRDGASRQANVIGYLTNGEMVEVTGYVEDEETGDIIDWVQISFNGGVGYVHADFLGYEDGAFDLEDEVIVISDTEDGYEVEYQPTYYGSNVVYPRVDRQLTGAYTTWCSLNTDGYYYNEVGARFADLGNGTFEDTAGNVLTVIQ